MYEPDWEATDFIIDQGLFWYKVMPFGLKNVDITYQMLVMRMFKECIRDTMDVYIVDTMVKSPKSEDHMDHLDMNFQIMCEHKIMLNPAKCTFEIFACKFLSFIIT